MFKFMHDFSGKRRRVKLGFHLTVSAVVVVMALLVLIYPAVTIFLVATDTQLRETGESRYVPMWFESATPRFLSWANTYLETNYAGSLYHDDIPATEWPMFGATFFLVTAEDLQRQGKIDAKQGTIREAVEKAAEIVASPTTATWVKTKWGDGYLEKENVFYRMLLIMGAIVLRADYRRWAVSRDDGRAARLAGRRTGRGQAAPARRLPRRVLSGRHALGRGGNSAGGAD